jgi:hypothetical protein
MIEKNDDDKNIRTSRKCAQVYRSQNVDIQLFGNRIIADIKLRSFFSVKPTYKP